MRTPFMRTRREPGDLGFGTVIGTSRGERMLNRDGTFTVRRRGLGFRALLSLYFSLLTMSWTAFLALFTAAYMLLNAAFATAYVACGPDAIAGPGEAGFGRAFFFSVQTLSGIGYGHLAPATNAANAVVTAEALLGLLSLALATGLVFARFSRPTADILFSTNAIVAPYRGTTGLMFRIANRRRNQIIELEAKVFVSMIEMVDGRVTRRWESLALERGRVTFFPLHWTVVHPLDEASPLHGMGPEDLAERDAEILVMLTGIDETFSQTVHARSSYKADEIVWNVRFKDILQRHSAGNPASIDVSRLHELEPV